MDGRSVPFAGGGRVVKNVTGYDLHQLLAGSLVLAFLAVSAAYFLLPAS